MMSRLRTFGPIVAFVLFFGVFLSACGGSSGGSAASQQQCFTQMTPDQVAQVQAQNANVNVSPDSLGTSTVCVLDQNGNERYYNRNDGSNFLLYAALLGRSNTLATIGLFSGDISPFDYLVLSSLNSVDRYGNVYHPYHQTSTGYARYSTPVKVKNVHVTNVYYGNSNKAVPLKTANKSKPAGYTATKAVPKVTQKSATPSTIKPSTKATSPSVKAATPSTKASTPTKTKPSVKTYVKPPQAQKVKPPTKTYKSPPKTHTSTSRSYSHH